MRVLIIEQTDEAGNALALSLKGRGFNPYSTILGEEGVDLAKHYDYDVIALELELDDMDGLSVLREMRRAGVKAPVLMMGDGASVAQRVQTLGAGADDFLSKPFQADELAARLGALVRRSAGFVTPTLTAGPISLDPRAGEVSVNGNMVRLTKTESRMLEALMLRKGNLVTKDGLMAALYGGHDEPEIKIIDVLICKVRNRLRAAGASRYIQTIWGRGYLISDVPLASKGDVQDGPDPRIHNCTTRVLIELTEGPLTVKQLKARLPDLADTLQMTMGSVSRNRRTNRVGAGAAAVYSITANGLAWLKKLGWAPETAVAA